MANRRHIPLLAAWTVALLSGCVSIGNRNGINPPSALCAHVRGSVGIPRGPVSVGGPKRGESGSAVHVKEWFFSGASANVTDMALKAAAESGGIRRIDYADYELTSYLGFVTVFNLVAYGE